MNPVLGIERHMNAATAGEWAAFAPHRAQVMRALDVAGRALLPAGSAPSLCILGAGNLNDVDLATLTSNFGELHLVDIDRDALTAAVERHTSRSREGRGRITIHAPMDISGITQFIHLRRSLPASLPEIASNLSAIPLSLSTVKSNAGGRFDVVLSSCLISQLLRQLNEAFPMNESVRRALAQIVRDAHVRTMLSLLSTGGVGVLVTEFTGSSIAPTDFARISDSADVNAEAQRLISEGKYFAWLAPHELKEFALGRQCGGWVWRARTTAPWLWSFLDKRYLCYALQVQRSLNSCGQLDKE